MDGWNAEAFDRWLTTEPEYESEACELEWDELWGLVCKTHGDFCFKEYE
jgi:hypothetical protein